MMPDPGRQNPIPYLEAAEDRKSKTSLLVDTAYFKSALPPKELSRSACGVVVPSIR